MTAREKISISAIRRWPPTCNVADAASALGVSRATLYAALARGERPVRVITVSRRMKVITASLVEVLEGGASDRAISA